MLFLKNFFYSAYSVFYQNKNILYTFNVFIGWVLFILQLPKHNNLKTLNISRFELEKHIIKTNIFFYIVDFLILYYINKNTNVGIKTFGFKISGVNNNKFYMYNNTSVNNNQLFLYGLRSIWNHLRL
jgi:hypothetical protein